VSGSTLYSVYNSAPGLFNVTNSILIGNLAGASASNASSSNFIGFSAGTRATNANNSNFIGYFAGQQAVNANTSNFIGDFAGSGATNAASSNFIGYLAGSGATSANTSNFIGYFAGYAATGALESNFIGNSAGYEATNANNSIFIGRGAGFQANSASYSVLIGDQVGVNEPGKSIGINNIVIGTSVTLAKDQRDAVNIAGILFATGAYDSTFGPGFSGSVANAKVGIDNPLPQYTLDVSGSFRVQDGVAILEQVSQSLNFADDTAAQAGGVPLGGLYRSGSIIVIRLV
jgi:hypothetical protein